MESREIDKKDSSGDVGVLERRLLQGIREGREMDDELGKEMVTVYLGYKELLEEEVGRRQRAEEEAQDIKAELARLRAQVRDLEAFSYSICHELRSPLRSINGFATMLLEEYQDALDPDGRRHLEVIVKRACSMDLLIDSLLLFSKVNVKKPNISTINPAFLVQKIIESMDASDVEFRVGSLPPAQGDPVLIHQVLVNLLSNAVKFSRGKKHAVIEVGGTAAESENIYFVRDNGVGFEEKEAGVVFGVFHRLHRKEDFEGHGVGLAVVERIVSRHGGRVWAESVVGKGATFYFSLPSVPPNAVEGHA